MPKITAKKMVEQVCIGVNPGGLGVATSPDFGLGVVGVLGGCGRVSENKPFHSSSFRYRLTYIDRYVINSGCVIRTGYFLSQPITTLENISYIFLAQSAWKTQVYMENYNLLQHNKLAL